MKKGEKNSITGTSSSNYLKRKRNLSSSSELPPLPSKFHDLYASTVRNSTRDDPSLHGGRKRVTPHIEGIGQPIFILSTFLTSDLGAPLPLHVSLSRTIGFSKDVKDAFLNSFEKAIKISGIRPFETGFPV
ncbi:hypothetical protein DID88_008877 [Monilinia fructigena]|uniref:U6 snRNA phosphodiesterase 1 n=1 Tax=Monilinia fructigena TaxID=38457 RepID=A0A395J6Q9_9HELO|nr:hypothetical protein DID88_008877 [Monilinia fructigena]